MAGKPSFDMPEGDYAGDVTAQEAWDALAADAEAVLVKAAPGGDYRSLLADLALRKRLGRTSGIVELMRQVAADLRSSADPGAVALAERIAVDVNAAGACLHFDRVALAETILFRHRLTHTAGEWGAA